MSAIPQTTSPSEGQNSEPTSTSPRFIALASQVGDAIQPKLKRSCIGWLQSWLDSHDPERDRFIADLEKLVYARISPRLKSDSPAPTVSPSPQASPIPPPQPKLPPMPAPLPPAGPRSQSPQIRPLSPRESESAPEPAPMPPQGPAPQMMKTGRKSARWTLGLCLAIGGGTAVHIWNFRTEAGLTTRLQSQNQLTIKLRIDLANQAKEATELKAELTTVRQQLEGVRWLIPLVQNLEVVRDANGKIWGQVADPPVPLSYHRITETNTLRLFAPLVPYVPQNQ